MFVLISQHLYKTLLNLIHYPNHRKHTFIWIVPRVIVLQIHHLHTLCSKKCVVQLNLQFKQHWHMKIIFEFLFWNLGSIHYKAIVDLASIRCKPIGYDRHFEEKASYLYYYRNWWRMHLFSRLLMKSQMCFEMEWWLLHSILKKHSWVS